MGEMGEIGGPLAEADEAEEEESTLMMYPPYLNIRRWGEIERERGRTGIRI